MTSSNPVGGSDCVGTKKQRTRADFLFLEELGEGSFSTVHLVTERSTSRRYAIKVLSKVHIVREKKVKEVFREKEVLRILSAEGHTHPNVIQLYCTFQDEGSLYFVLTYASQRDLARKLQKAKRFNTEQCRFACAEIVSAIGHIHTLNIVHRDLKPENILVKEDGHLLLTDFGCAKILERGASSDARDKSTENGEKSGDGDRAKRRSSFVGSPPYVSPEVLNGREVATAIDYWSLGVTLFELLYSKRPFSDVSEYLIYKRILNLRYAFPVEDDFKHPACARDLVKRLLVLSPKDRLGSEENGGAESVKCHEFFAGIDWGDLCNNPSPLLLIPS